MHLALPSQSNITTRSTLVAQSHDISSLHFMSNIALTFGLEVINVHFAPKIVTFCSTATFCLGVTINLQKVRV
jgi:hypothetical protein